MKKLFTLLGALVITVGCTSTGLNDSAKNGIVIAYNAQVAAGQTYNDAKAQETKASQACAAAAQAKALPAPSVKTAADWPAVRDLCASLGAPIPFDPFALQKAAAPVNGLLDAVNAANKIRIAFEGGTVSADVLTSAVLQLASLFVEIETDLVTANVPVPASIDNAATTLKQIGAGK
jgi:hypothetical protein